MTKKTMNFKQKKRAFQCAVAVLGLLDALLILFFLLVPFMPYIYEKSKGDEWDEWNLADLSGGFNAAVEDFAGAGGKVRAHDTFLLCDEDVIRELTETDANQIPLSTYLIEVFAGDLVYFTDSQGRYYSCTIAADGKGNIQHPSNKRKLRRNIDVSSVMEEKPAE